MVSRGKHSRRLLASRRVRVVLFVAAGLLVAGGGSAFAAYRYDVATSSRLLPGVSIAGVDVGDMSRDEAVRAVSAHADLSLSSDLEVQAAGKTWHVTPASLGMSADVEGALGDAFAVADSLPFVSRVYHRLTDHPVDRSIELGYIYDQAGIDAFVKQAYDAVTRPPVDASITLLDGQLVTRHSQEGRSLKAALAAARIRAALGQHLGSVTIPVKPLDPAVDESRLGYTIVIRLSENKLYLYRGLRVVNVYPVATARPGFTTPIGTWHVIDKMENPTWVNPAPHGWGAGEPAVIPPGPGNPLGTRALYLDAPGIRIHGTYDSSSIGTYASHGCVRMFISDSEELFSIVPVGTTVIILQ